MRASPLLPALIFLAIACPGQNIPPGKLHTLSGTTVDIPADLHGKLAVLVVGFSKKASQQTNPWFQAVQRQFGSDPHVIVYEVPVLASVPSLVRGPVLHGMRSGAPPEVQSHMLPALSNEQAWKAFAHFSAPDEAYVIVLDPNANPAWHGSGVPSEEKTATAIAAIQQLETTPR